MSNRKVALVNITEPYRTRYLEREAPLALMYLSAALKEKSFDTLVKDITAEEINQAVQDILDFDPLFLGITASFGVFAHLGLEFSKKIYNQSPAINIIWGGINVSMTPDLHLQEDSIHFVCIGEGEKTIQEFAIELSNGRFPSSVNGLAYRKNGKMHVNPPRELEKNIDNFKIDWDCIDVQKYIRRDLKGDGTFFSYQSSRGCPFDCAFCYNSAFNKRRFRPHSTEYVLQDIRLLKERYHFNVLRLVDDNFFANKRRAFHIMERLYEMKVSLLALDVRAPDVNDDFMRNLRRYKCRSVFFGFESENERLLKLMKKEITKKDIENAVEVSSKYPEVRIGAQVILGVPTHTKEEIIATIKYCLELIKRYPHFNVTPVTYVPLPGSDFFRLVIENGYSLPSRVEDFSRIGVSTAKNLTKFEWLKWVTKRDVKALGQIYSAWKYLLIVRPKKKNFLVELIKYPFFEMLCWRFSNLNFKFPADIIFLDFLYSAFNLVRPAIRCLAKRGFRKYFSEKCTKKS